MFETYTLEDRPEQINGLGWRQPRNETFKAEKSDWSNKKKVISILLKQFFVQRESD